jgi:hypothetical protein
MDLQADIFVVIGYVRHIIEKEWTMVEPRVLLSVGKNGYIVSTAAPQYQPSDALLKAMTHHAEDLGFHFVLSPVNYRGWGGPTELGDYVLESFEVTAAHQPCRHRGRPLPAWPALPLRGGFLKDHR